MSQKTQPYFSSSSCGNNSTTSYCSSIWSQVVQTLILPNDPLFRRHRNLFHRFSILHFSGYTKESEGSKTNLNEDEPQEADSIAAVQQAAAYVSEKTFDVNRDPMRRHLHQDV